MRFCATLNDGSFINIQADRMDVRENMLFVWNGMDLVGLVEMGAIISARIGEVVKVNG